MSTSSNTSVTPPRPKFLDPTGGSSMPPGNSLQDLLTHHGVADDLDAPEPMSATANPTVSPHRFLTSAALHEYEPRSRPNFSVHDEEGCIDISAPVIAIDTCPTGIGQSFRLLHSPSSMPAMPSFPDSVAEPSGSTLQVPPADMPNGASFIFSGDEEKDFEKNLELIVRRLREAVHLSVLPRQELEFLAHHLDISTPPKGTVVLPFGTVCKGVYVVLRGRVAVFKPDAVVPDKFVSQWWLQRGDIFGFDSIVLRAQSARRYEVMTDDAVIGFFNYSVFFQLVTRNPRMSHSVARKMCEDMNTFKVFKEYARAVFAPTIDPAAGVVVWSKVLEKFGKINNGIYPDMHANRLDTGAWMYALRRLPDNITRSLVIELAKAPPPMMASHMRRLSAAYDRNPATLPSTTDGRITYVGCSVRRRPSFQLGHGKTLVILRDSTTDLLDFTSCMCVHLNESEKLRSRLFNMTDPGLIPLMERCIESSDIDEIRETLKKLPFDEDEAKGLIKLWGKDTMRNMFDIVTTRRDDLQVRVDLRSYRRFYRTPSSIFAANIRHTILQRLGLPEDGDLPPNLVVDIISSNAHGIKNSFSYFPRKHAAAILKYASEKMGDVVQMNWHNRDDLVYYCASKYLDAHEEARHEFTASLRKSGISVLEETSMTGLEVDVIDLRDIDAAHVDGFLADAARHAKDRLSSPFAAPHYIINMDFPFGSQAESVMKSLAHTFGHHIRSMNIMGKGGGIVGKRGDIQFPTHVLFSKSSVPFDDFVDELRPCGQHDLDLDKMRAMVGSDREVHQGPVLTIAGTMCQNSKLLRMYKHLWGCIGMEMEGSYFDRALGEAMQQGVLRHDLKTRFLYYTSDTPLASEKESLAAGMTPTEGVPPLYAITRVFLDCILRDNTR